MDTADGSGDVSVIREPNAGLDMCAIKSFRVSDGDVQDHQKFKFSP